MDWGDQFGTCHFGLRRIQFDLGLELRLWWPTSQGCHHQLQQLTDNSPNPLDKYNKPPSSCKGDSEWSLVQAAATPNPEDQSSWWSSRTQHTTSCSATCSYSTLNFSTWWWGYKSGEEEERRIWRRGGDGNWGRGRWCICQWLRVDIWHDDEEIDMNIALWTS